MRRSLVLLTTQGRDILERLVAEHLRELSPLCEHLIKALRDLQGAVEHPAP
jgi:DNA-binding MarR family transcriptional regulator